MLRKSRGRLFKWSIQCCSDMGIRACYIGLFYSMIRVLNCRVQCLEEYLQCSAMHCFSFCCFNVVFIITFIICTLQKLIFILQIPNLRYYRLLLTRNTIGLEKYNFHSLHIMCSRFTLFSTLGCNFLDKDNRQIKLTLFPLLICIQLY